jgi:catechol 2,3-dioxygenase-like lactoylglutathione lyase family enzyme
MRLNHVTLIVSGLSRSLDFYTGLGLSPIVLEQPRYARLTLPDGDETLSLEVTGVSPSPSRVQLYLECADLDEVCARLRQDGFSFEQDPTDMSYLWREARLLDPDGHQIRLYRAGQHRLNPPWRMEVPPPAIGDATA